MLTKLGYNVVTASNGVEAISALIEYDSVIDVILMDQLMPVKDGITATREIRKLELDGTLSRRTTILAATAVVSQHTKDQFNEAGADDFLSKPLEMKVLERMLVKFS